MQVNQLVRKCAKLVGAPLPNKKYQNVKSKLARPTTATRREPAPMTQVTPLTQATLQNFNKQRGLSVDNKNVDVIAQADKHDFENNQMEANHVHKDFGKIPKYLQTYKKKAETLEQQRAMLKAQKKIPAGTR